MKVFECVVSILSGLAVCIPLVITLVRVVQKAVREKNWNVLITKMAQFMSEAELIYDDDHNFDRKQYVMQCLKTVAKSVNYDLTEDDLVKLSSLIDTLCTMARTVNGPKD